MAIPDNVKWEYKFVKVNRKNLIEPTLNDFGERGWELVTAYTEYHVLALYFKRPKQGV